MGIEIEPAHLDFRKVRKKAFEMYSDVMVFGVSPEDFLRKLSAQHAAYIADPMGMIRDFESNVGGDAEMYFAAIGYLIDHYSSIQAAYESYAALRRAGTALNLGAILESIDSADF